MLTLQSNYLSSLVKGKLESHAVFVLCDSKPINNMWLLSIWNVLMDIITILTLISEHTGSDKPGIANAHFSLVTYMLMTYWNTGLDITR